MVTAEEAGHRLDLLHGDAPSAPSLDRPDRGDLAAAEVELLGREALAAGRPDIARSLTAGGQHQRPWVQAVFALLEGRMQDNSKRWHEALSMALEHDLRLVAVDAIEGIAIDAAHSESWNECLRLAGAATRLREETGYRWMFTTERQALDDAVASAIGTLGVDTAEVAQAEGARMTWREAATYAQRARGERRRPSHGWASLTPTESRVVEMVVEGLTNPQIADRLLMGRATVKTHLEHIFAKLGVSSRSELAAQAARRA
jgi:DNA-binding CsgD family transcriptional regulator